MMNMMIMMMIMMNVMKDDDDDKLNKQTQMKQQSLTIDCAGTCAAPLYLASQGK